MSNKNLLETLINRKLLHNDTQVQLTTDSGSYLVKSIDKDSGGLFFKVLNIENKKFKKVSSDKILMIDGMDPAGLADAYDIMPDGNKKVLGKRRGRPRKHFRPETF